MLHIPVNVVITLYKSASAAVLLMPPPPCTPQPILNIKFETPHNYMYVCTTTQCVCQTDSGCMIVLGVKVVLEIFTALHRHGVRGWVGGGGIDRAQTDNNIAFYVEIPASKQQQQSV